MHLVKAFMSLHAGLRSIRSILPYQTRTYKMQLYQNLASAGYLKPTEVACNSTSFQTGFFSGKYIFAALIGLDFSLNSSA